MRRQVKTMKAGKKATDSEGRGIDKAFVNWLQQELWQAYCQGIFWQQETDKNFVAEHPELDAEASKYVAAYASSLRTEEREALVHRLARMSAQGLYEFTGVLKKLKRAEDELVRLRKNRVTEKEESKMEEGG